MALTRAPAFADPEESEETLLLREFGHRAMNELAVARSAVAVARRRVSADLHGPTAELLDEAGARLDGAGGLMRLLARPLELRVELSVELYAVCRATLAARPGSGDVVLDLDLPEVWVDGAAARRVILIAAELVANAWRHALAGGAGVLSVRLRRSRGRLVLEVRDQAARPAAAAVPAGMGLGAGIVAGLARLAGGTVALAPGPTGMVATLTMPVGRGVEPARAR